MSPLGDLSGITCVAMPAVLVISHLLTVVAVIVVVVVVVFMAVIEVVCVHRHLP
ncbi:hypothetical protein SSPS47_26845 [Streptomyces sp. S4.7]|nr:hypothetical protein SSPS47_26845 [Streptomyces sp. S4.7]